MTEETTQSKKITIGLILSWVFGVVFALNGIIFIFFVPTGGLIMLIMSIVILPPVTKLVDKKWKFHLSKGVKVGVIIIGLILFGATVDTSNIQQAEIQKEKQQIVDNEIEIPPTANQIEEEYSQNESNEQKETEIVTIPPSTEAKDKAFEEVKPTTPIDPVQIPSPIESEDKSEPISIQTVSQKNAVKSAKAYLDYSAFSHDGLVAQLEYEQFSHADAIYGADNSGGNWNEQAVKAAKAYLDYSSFSRGSLIDQLKYEQFTQSQAEYGANAVGL
jgi:hypothetical protein